MQLFDQARPYMAHDENGSFIRYIFKEAVYGGDASDILERHVSIHGIFVAQFPSLAIPKRDFDDFFTAINPTIACLNFNLGIVDFSCSSFCYSDVSVKRK